MCVTGVEVQNKIYLQNPNKINLKIKKMNKSLFLRFITKTCIKASCVSSRVKLSTQVLSMNRCPLWLKLVLHSNG